MTGLLGTKIDLRDEQGGQSPENVKKFIEAIGCTDKKMFNGWHSYDDIAQEYISKAAFIYVSEIMTLSLGVNESYDKEWFKKHKYREIKLSKVVSYTLGFK